MYPIVFRVGSWEIHSWGVMFALAFGLAILVAELNSRRLGIPAWSYVEASLYIALGAIAGARLLYVALEWGSYAQQPWRILNTREGGLSLYGGLLGGVLAVAIFARRRRLSVGRFLDGGAPALALGTAVARVGCFLEGCCWGVLTGGGWGFRTRFVPGLRHPAQLYEMAGDLALFAALWWLTPRWKGKEIPGQLFLAYLGGYSLLRFGMEFVRDVPHLWGWITVTQPAALATTVASWGLIWYRERRRSEHGRAGEGNRGRGGGPDGANELPDLPGVS